MGVMLTQLRHLPVNVQVQRKLVLNKINHRCKIICKQCIYWQIEQNIIILEKILV